MTIAANAARHSLRHHRHVEAFSRERPLDAEAVYDDPQRQYPADPLVRVRVQGLGDDLFFMKELEPVPVSDQQVLNSHWRA